MHLVHSEASIAEASRLMRQWGESELVVMAQAGGEARALGVVTADDIVRRVVAVGLDPRVLTVGDLTSFQ